MHLIMGEAEHGTGQGMIAQSRRGRRAEPSGEFFTTDFTDGHGWDWKEIGGEDSMRFPGLLA